MHSTYLTKMTLETLSLKTLLKLTAPNAELDLNKINVTEKKSANGLHSFFNDNF